jgi:murein tripeptide amidase MpaA
MMLNALRIAVVAVAIGLVAAARAEMERYDGDRVVRVTVTTRADLDLLLSMTDDVWSETLRPGPVDVRVSAAQFEQLRASGLPHEVIIPDVQALVDQQFTQRGVSRDAFDQYLSYSEVVEYLDTLVALRPDLAETFVVGQSLQNRDIVGIRIRGSSEGLVPTVFYNGCQHAREWITVSVILYVADQLVREYDTDDAIRDLVDRYEWQLVPIVNPDGYVYSWTTQRMWRKNRRLNWDGSRGVDLNRNWGYAWGGPGASGIPSADTYRGAHAFSEPETQALRDWIQSHPNIVAYCDLHSYGQLVMYPFGYADRLPDPRDLPHYAHLAETMTDLVYDVHGYTYEYGPVFSTIYQVSGGSVDWVYGANGIFAFTYELRDTGTHGFLLPPWQIRPNCEEVFPALLFLADYLYADCNENGVWDPQDIAAGTSADCNENNVPDECEPGGLSDCNGNGQSDLCDIYTGYSTDCNGNGIPDECDIADGTSPDCNGNGIPDECDLAPPTDIAAQDLCADAQFVFPPATYFGDLHEADNDGSASCGDSAGAPDVWFRYRPHGGGFLTVSLCGSAYDTVLSVHSGCPGTVANEIACNDDYCFEQSRLDVVVLNGNDYWIRVSGGGGDTGTFQISFSGPPGDYNADCNGNGVPDECDIADGTSADCNGNGVPDECDIAAGTSLDVDGNGIPDECELFSPGDLNCDGLVNSFDIDPFVLALTTGLDEPPFAGYFAAQPGCDPMLADINGDGLVNSFDIDPFVQLVTGR